VSYHCNRPGKHKSSCPNSKCVWESIESEKVPCALPTSRWAGYTSCLAPWDCPSLWMVLHWGLNPLPPVSVTKLPLRTRQEAQGYVGWTQSRELRALLTSPRSQRSNLPSSAEQVPQTLWLAPETVRTSQRNGQLKAPPPDLPVLTLGLSFKSLLNAYNESITVSTAS